MVQPMIPYEDQAGLEERIRFMSTEHLLNLWEQSQKICLTLQDSLPGMDRVTSLADERITLELLRRSVLGERCTVIPRSAAGRAPASRG